MNYSDLTEVYERLDSTTKRLEKTYFIAQFIRTTPKECLKDILLLLQGRLYPHFDQTEIGVASKLVSKAISLATGVDKDKVDAEWAKVGDLGIVAEGLAKKRRQTALFQNDLTVKRVVDNLRRLPGLEGTGSVDLKLKLIAELLTSAKPKEVRYIVRTVLGELRLGVGDGSIRDAIAWAFFAPVEGILFRCDACGSLIPPIENCPSCKKKLGKKPEAQRPEYNTLIEAIQHAFDITNDFGEVAILAKEKGREGLMDVEFLPGKPLKVMLAQKVADVKEGIARVGTPAVAEYKYDGFRMQVHKANGQIRLFTRRLDEVTAQFPDVVDSVKKRVRGDDFILDGEAVGFDPNSGKYMPFQHVSQRIRRKYDIKGLSEKLPVELNVFDCLYFNGKSLLKEPFSARRRMIEEHIDSLPRHIRLAESIITSEEAVIVSFYQAALDAGMEGIMLKSQEAGYKPGSRVGYMVKLKPTMDTFDLVIVGAEWGEGKRAEWLTSFTLACVNDEGSFLEIGKVGTGIKELEAEGLTFSQLTEMLRPDIIETKGKEVKVMPRVVVEIKFEEVQRSPTYGSGFALRFPRLVQIRADRAPEDASNLAQIEDAFYSQKSG